MGSKIVGARQDQVDQGFRLMINDAPFDTAYVELKGTIKTLSYIRLIT